MKKHLKIKVLVLASVLLAAAGQALAGIGIVQRWHGAIAADGVVAQELVGMNAPTAITTPVAGTGCNTSSLPVTGTGSTGISGTVGITCGGTGATAATVLTLTLPHTYQTAPFCEVTPYNAATAAIPIADAVFPAPTTNTLVIKSNATGLPAGTYLWYYACVGAAGG